MVLGYKPKDLDLAGNALPHEIIPLFRTVIPTGIQHGTVTIVESGIHFELTTFRIDGDYSDARRPDQVHFTQDLYQDLKRRDFTVNAMAIDLDRSILIDPHGGQDDLKAGLIRTVGKALDRFNEDALRIVRGIRFACQLNFTISPETLAGMKKSAQGLSGVSVERFRDELFKILTSKQASAGLKMLNQLHILTTFMPSFMLLNEDEFLLRLNCLATIHDDYLLSLAGLFIGSTDLAALEQTLRSLKLSKQELRFVLKSTELSLDLYQETWSDARLRLFMADAGREVALSLINLHETYAAFKGNRPNSAKALNRCQLLLEQDPPLSLGQLSVTGVDLLALGIVKDKRLGVILQSLLAEVIADPKKNRREYLCAQAMLYYQGLG